MSELKILNDMNAILWGSLPVACFELLLSQLVTFVTQHRQKISEHSLGTTQIRHSVNILWIQLTLDNL